MISSRSQYSLEYVFEPHSEPAPSFCRHDQRNSASSYRRGQSAGFDHGATDVRLLRDVCHLWPQRGPRLSRQWVAAKLGGRGQKNEREDECLAGLDKSRPWARVSSDSSPDFPRSLGPPPHSAPSRSAIRSRRTRVPQEGIGGEVGAAGLTGPQHFRLHCLPSWFASRWNVERAKGFKMLWNLLISRLDWWSFRLQQLGSCVNRLRFGSRNTRCSWPALWLNFFDF